MRILVANFFPAFHPPRSGGEQRYYHFYQHLSRFYDVTLLSHSYSHGEREEISLSPTFREIRIPKEPVFDALHVELDARGIGPECSAYVVALGSAVETSYSRAFAMCVADADLVVHEFPYTLPYDRSFGVDHRPRIYNAHNVEHRLARQMLRGEVGGAAADFIRFLEEALVRNAAQVFATCEEDRRAFAEDFGVRVDAIALAPNGFEPSAEIGAAGRARRKRTVVFIGSAHPPNIEAARFVVDDVAPNLPDVEFRILGAVGNKLEGKLPRNVRRLGIVDEQAKVSELAECTIAINPMFSGSGTNLKALDYLAAGAPTVMTGVGARGLGLVDGESSLIARPAHFAARLRDALDDELLRARIGAAGRELALARFSWEKIVEKVREPMEAVIAKERSGRFRPRLLAVNDFPVSGARGGGEVRIRELLTELAREFEVVLLCFARDERRSVSHVTPRFTEIRIPRTSAHRDADMAAARGEVVSVADLVASEYCRDNLEFVALFRAIASRADAVIFEHPYLVPLARLLPADARVVYSSLNVERRLKADLLKQRRDARHRMEQTEALEREMLARAGLVVCVSEADRHEFASPRMNASVVVENGVRIEGRPVAGRGARAGSRMLAVFLGSGHPPNIEAARFLIERLAPAIPMLDVVIVGGVCEGVGALAAPPNVHLIGALDTGEKDALLARAALALNPLFGGGGSSLKVPDFFAAGLPLVSTGIGVRGYDLRDGVHYVEATRDDFVARTQAVVRDEALRNRLAKNAREYALRRLDWSIVGRRYREAMRSFLDVPPRVRVLVVTYRFADPPPGGAETFLVNLLKGLNQRGHVAVDVAGCDVGAIANHWHFSAHYEPGQAATTPAYCENLFRFPVDPAGADTLLACRRLFSCWMAETREQALELGFDVVARPTLLGGWNFPERRDGDVVRWTSREAHVGVGARARRMRVRMYSPALTRVEARCGEAVIASRTAAGHVEWSFDLPASIGVVALRVAKPFTAQDDPRELGVLVEALELDEGDGWRPLPLDEDFDAVARRDDVAAWVRSLIGVAARRDAETDALFQRVRGPHSRALEAWLEANIDEYDVVLAHGTPFSTAVVATDVAQRHRVPVVALPHLHMEDRYYHWQAYYAMFRAANRVVAAPASAKPLFFDRIGAASIALPGGGVDPDEFDEASLERAAAAFAALHHAESPFVLVLGRKTAAKRYRLAVDAVAALNAREHRVDLVVIGPDEDGQPIIEPHVHLYGAQPRDVVVGALARSLCLVNMSESESFGIVLLESWLAGRPVVAARKCAAFADLVVQGENGFLVESAEELIAAIDAYLRDPEVAATHANRGRALAGRYTWARIAEAIEELLLAATRSPAARDRSIEHAGAGW